MHSVLNGNIVCEMMAPLKKYLEGRKFCVEGKRTKQLDKQVYGAKKGLTVHIFSLKPPSSTYANKPNIEDPD